MVSVAERAATAGGVAGGVALRHELWRKALHLSSAAAPVSYAAGLSRDVVLAVLVALALAAVLVELARRRPPVQPAFERHFGMMLRAHEHERWTGATWLLLSYVLVVWLAEPAIAIAAMWAVAAGDALAAIVGRRWGAATRVGSGGKSIVGSAACAVVTFAGALFLARLGPGLAAVATLAAAGAEWPARPFDDNVRIVLAVVVAVMCARWVLALA